MPQVTGPIIPADASFPGMDDAYLLGGYRSVATLSDRNGIDDSRKKQGMLCYVRSEDAIFKLEADLSTWSEFSASTGSLGTVRNLAEFGMSPTGSGLANTAAFQAAVDASLDGDSLFLPPGSYEVNSDGYVTIAKSVSLLGVKGFSRLVNSVTYSATSVYYTGVVNGSASATLTRCHFPGDTILYVSSTVGLSVGQWINIRDSLSLYAWNGQDTVNEDTVKIEAVASGQLTIHRPLTRRYLTSRAASVHVFSTPPPSVAVEGIEFDRCRLDMLYCADSVVRNCRSYRSDYPAFSFRNCTGCLLENCTTESPQTKTSSGLGAAFYLNNCTLCDVRGHVARWCEGAVVRRGTRLCSVRHSRFEGASSGLATYSGDCRHNTVSDCTFVGAQLVWGAGGHFADSYNKSSDCTFLKPVTRAIGNAGSALAELAASFDGRAMKAGSYHGFDPGQAVILYGTTIPTGLTASRRYFVTAPTYGSGTWGNEFLLSATPAIPQTAVTFDGTSRYVSMGGGWATGDAVVFHGASMPAGVDANRIYFLRNASSTNFYLQRRPGQTATFASATNTVTLAGAAGVEWEDGQMIMFSGTLPAELSSAPAVYYLRDKSSTDTFKLALTAGGTAIDLTTDGSGTIYALSAVTGFGSGVITVEGGTPISLSGTASSAVVTTIGEGNVFEGHIVHDAPANVVHIHRCAGTVFRDCTFLGSQDMSNGACLFTLSACTDWRIDGCTARNGTSAAYNRVAHLSTCFDITIQDGEYDLRTGGQLFTGGSSENIRVMGTAFTGISSRGSLFGSSTLPAVSLCDGITLSGNQLSGSPASVQIIGDESIEAALPGTTGNVLVWTTDLTEDRTVSLDDGNAVPGDWVEVVRNCGGAYALSVRNASDASVLFSFDGAETGFVRFAWEGAEWSQCAWNKSGVVDAFAMRSAINAARNKASVPNGGSYIAPASGTANYVISAATQAVTLGNQWRVKRDVDFVDEVQFYFGSKTNVTKFEIVIWRCLNAYWFVVATTGNLIDLVTANTVNTITLPIKLSGLRAGDHIGWGIAASAYPVTPLLYAVVGGAGNRSVVTVQQPAAAAVYNLWNTGSNTNQNDLGVPIRLLGTSPEIVATGDSLTAGAPGTRSLAEPAISPYFDTWSQGDQYSYYVGQALGLVGSGPLQPGNRVQNMGISSQTSAQILARFAADVTGLHPKIAMICMGTNDIPNIGNAGSYAGLIANWVSAIDACLAGNVFPVCIAIPPRSGWCNSTDYWAAQMRRAINSALESLIEGTYANRALYVNLDSTLGQNYVNGDAGNLDAQKTAYNADSVHFNSDGYIAWGNYVGAQLKALLDLA